MLKMYKNIRPLHTQKINAHNSKPSFVQKSSDSLQQLHNTHPGSANICYTVATVCFTINKTKCKSLTARLPWSKM